jgi:hydroxyacylglutathione hydrolase
MEIFKGVSIVPGIGNDSNIYIVDNEILVDTGTGEFFHQARKEIENSVDPKRLKMIVNTHYHFDHTGGNKKFRDWLHTEIAAHEADRDFIERGKTLSESFHQVAKIVTVDKELKDGNIIRTENFNLVVIHTPGHSAGSICLYEPEKKILISGDTLFDGNVGRVDLPGGNYNELRFSLEKLNKYNIQCLFPGHGSPKIGGVDFMIKKLLISMESSHII